MSDPDPFLERMTEIERRLDVMQALLNQLEHMLRRMGELRQAIETGVPPPPPPAIN
jgi:hypothetical protein